MNRPFAFTTLAPNVSWSVTRVDPDKHAITRGMTTWDDEERGRHVSTRPAGVQSRYRRGIAIATGLVTIGGLAVFASVAGGLTS